MIANAPSHIPSLLDRCPGGLFGTPAEEAFAPITLTSDTSESFAERFCCHFNVSVEDFEAEILRHTLHPQARLVNLFAPWDFFYPDRTFVSSVGQLTHRCDFDAEAKEFQRDPRNGSFLRRRCRLRVSVRRLRRLFDEIWPEAIVPVTTDASLCR